MIYNLPLSSNYFKAYKPLSFTLTSGVKLSSDLSLVIMISALLTSLWGRKGFLNTLMDYSTGSYPHHHHSYLYSQTGSSPEAWSKGPPPFSPTVPSRRLGMQRWESECAQCEIRNIRAHNKGVPLFLSLSGLGFRRKRNLLGHSDYIPYFTDEGNHLC